MDIPNDVEIVGAHGGWFVHLWRKNEQSEWEMELVLCLSIEEVLKQVEQCLKLIEQTDTETIDEALRERRRKS